MLNKEKIKEILENVLMSLLFSAVLLLIMILVGYVFVSIILWEFIDIFKNVNDMYLMIRMCILYMTFTSFLIYKSLK